MQPRTCSERSGCWRRPAPSAQDGSSTPRRAEGCTANAESCRRPEGYPIRPLAPYGQGKYAAEGYCELYTRLHGLATVSLRYGNVYGPRQDVHGEAGVVAIFCGALIDGRRPTVFGDGRQTRDWVDVSDVARANLMAADADVTGPFNIGRGEETSVLDLIDALNDVSRPRAARGARVRAGAARRGQPQLPRREPRASGARLGARRSSCATGSGGSWPRCEHRRRAWSAASGAGDLSQRAKVGVNHPTDQLLEAERRGPSELKARASGVADGRGALGRSLQLGIDPDVSTRVEPEIPEGGIGELRNSVWDAGSEDVVPRPRLLEHQPCASHHIPGERPVANCGQVAEFDLLRHAQLDCRGGPSDLARDEVLGAALGFVVIEDPRAREQGVVRAQLADQLVRGQLRCCVWGLRSAWSLLSLGTLPGIAEHRARGGDEHTR